MIESLQPYAEYKESGLPWVPQVPAHWSLIPNRAVLRKRKVLVGAKHKNFQLLSLTKGGVIVRDISTGKGKFSSDMGTSQEVRPGDFVFCLFDVPETPRTVGLAQHNGMITSAYTVFESRNLPPESVRYLERFYIAMDDRKLLSPLYSGLRHTIPPPRFLGTKTPQPPSDEQAAMVRFLDHANRKIDGFIRAKRKLIALLGEQKQAIIHRAVTRGLDTNAPLKPSGIPWLGDIPKHWEVLRARFLFRPVTRRDIKKDDPKMSVTQRRGLVPTDEMEENATQARSFDRFQVCYPQDLVLNKYKAHLGVFCCAFQRGLITPNYTVFRPTRRLHTYFFDILFHTTMYRNEFSMMVHGVTEGMSPLYTQDFNRVPVVFPPYEEQKKILEGIVLLTKPQDTAIARTEREIALMQEYRTRLTADVVTGKLDVRPAAAKLPDLPTDAPFEPAADEEPEEPEQEENEG
ncbi:restriction endonuclease subunit S [soil metagenome]